LPARRVRIVTRRPSLEEALSRHASAFGLQIVREPGSSALPSADEIVVLDAGTHRDELQFCLGTVETARVSVIAIATAADVEALGLRLLLDEKRIVLKPVHRIAFQDALACAAGVQTETAGAKREAASDTPALRGHILLVEDEAVNAAVAEGYIAAFGCTSVWVRNGTDAVSRSATERFDLILMDLNMPDMDGFAATTLIRKREGVGQRVPIVALTAHDAANYRDKCLKAGMDDILSKPYALEECARLLGRYLRPAKKAASSTDSSRSESITPAATATATASSGSGALVSIDANAVVALRKLRGDKNADLYSKLVGLFQTGSAESLGQLRVAFSSGDLTAAAGICHKLAASASNVGALVYGRELRRLEKLCVAGERAPAQELHAALQAAHAPLIDAMLAFTLRATA
jgi:CheY-like chemotaxis protein